MAKSNRAGDGQELAPATLTALSNLGDMWAKMDLIRQQQNLASLDSIPEGAFTAQQYAERYGITLTTARYQLRCLVKAGVMELLYANHVDNGGRLIRLQVFRPIEQLAGRAKQAEHRRETRQEEVLPCPTTIPASQRKPATYGGMTTAKRSRTR